MDNSARRMHPVYRVMCAARRPLPRGELVGHAAAAGRRESWWGSRLAFTGSELPVAHRVERMTVRAATKVGSRSTNRVSGEHERRTLEERSLMDNADFFVGWGTLSLINAGLAQPKGRSGLLWWIISLLLGPLATFLIVFLPPTSSAWKQ
jgi:hypothetical protein